MSTIIELDTHEKEIFSADAGFLFCWFPESAPNPPPKAPLQGDFFCIPGILFPGWIFF